MRPIRDWFRLRSAPWTALAVASASALGCARSLSHDFEPREARDYVTDRIYADDAAAPREELAVLLIPERTRVYLPSLPRPDSSWMGGVSEPVRQDYVGPARVFLLPGEHSYLVAVETSEGVVQLNLHAELEAGKRYELSVREDGENVTMELFKLHPSSYAELYPKP